MTPAQWARLDELYAEASALPAEAREAFVAGVCAQDGAIGDELRSLLDAGRGAGEFLNSPVIDVGSMALDQGVADPLVGTTLGSFAIERRLGSGGMGVVYLARQGSPQRSVALKVVRPDALSPGVLRRFRHEADVLARLQHPGIAQVYEFGQAQTALGVRPFFAMEFVDGKPLLRYADDAGLGVRQRLELFARVCDAVQYAHQRGVIHRDLKPANILVIEEGTTGRGEGAARSDGAGLGASPKVLDFGIARFTDSDVRVTTLQTDVGQLLGTVPYMSPEQASGNAADLDVRSDVYALGVILYELLAGRLPYDLKGKPVAEALRVITGSDPTSLSVVSRQFRGDIETIAAKALEKDRARRYQSAGELGEDVRRYLADRTILARPPSSAYQLRKFARRNKTLVGGVVVAFVLLAGGIVGTSVGMMHAREAQARALDTAAKAERANKYLRDTIGWFKPGRVKGPTVSLKEVLDSVSARIDKELADQPDVAAVMHTTVGESYLSLADYDRAELHAARALECCATAGAPESAGAIEAMILQVSSARGRGNYAAAEPIARRIIDIHLRTLPESHPLVAKARVLLGGMLRGLKRNDEAERTLAPAVEALRGASPPQPEAFMEGCNELAMLVRRTQPDRAIALMREAADVARTSPLVDAEITAILINNLATAVKDKGDLAEAERLYNETLELRRTLYGDDHAAVALAINNLGTVQLRRGETAAAEASFTKALEMRRRLLGPQHRMTLNTLENLARIQEDRANNAEAEAMFREAIEIRTRIDGADHPDTAAALGNLASIVGAQRRFDEATSMFEDSVRRLDAAFPSGSLELSNIYVRYATMLSNQGLYARAEEMSRLGLAWMEKNAPDRTVDISGALNQLAKTLRASGRAAEAEEPAKRAVDLFETQSVPGGTRLAVLRLTLAGTWDDLGRYAEAEPLLRRVIAAYEEVDPPMPLGQASAESELGACLLGLGRLEESEALLLRSVERVAALGPGNGWAEATVHARLARLYEAWGKPDLAASHRALAMHK